MNDSEQKVKAILESKGWRVLRNGWPDFLIETTIEPTGVLKVAAVEVKTGADILSREQREVHAVLNRSGIPVFTIRPEAVTAIEGNPQQTLATWEPKRQVLVSLTEIEHRLKEAKRLAATLEQSLEAARTRYSQVQFLFDHADGRYHWKDV